MEIKQIIHGSNEYRKMIGLRDTILRKPLGLALTPEDIAKEKDDIFIGAFDGTEIAGCCILTPGDKNCIHLRQMAVAKERRGKGTGKSLLTFAEDLAVDKGYRTITMHARDTATCFYEKCGYSVVGEGFTEVTIPHHSMEKILTLLRDAHALSASHTIDPNYSAEEPVPSVKGLSLFSRRPDGPHWLYTRGACEAFLLNRLRHESFYICSHIDHPGRFRTFSPVLFAQKNFTLSDLMPDAAFTLVYCGNIDIRVNGRRVFHQEATSIPVKQTVPFGCALKLGENALRIRVHAMNEPPAVLILDSPLMTDDSWQVGTDSQKWFSPTCFPFEGPGTFPHREEMPSVIMKPKYIESDLYDFGVEVLGRPRITVNGNGEITLRDGESKEEALDTDLNNHEQELTSLHVNSGVNEYPHELALRYLRVTASSNLPHDSVSLRSSVYPTAYRGAFAASDETLTDIWMHAAYTLRLCMRELFVDGIKRDRLPWVGDLYLGGMCNYFSFNEPLIVKNSLTALYGADPKAVDLSGIADYSLYWIIALRDYVMYSGDVGFMQHVKDDLVDLLKALRAKEDVRGMLPTAAMHWVFIDWTDLVREGYSSSLQMLYIMALDAAAELFQIMGMADAAGRQGGWADGLRELCRDNFWDPDKKAYADNRVGSKRGLQCLRHGSIFAILSGVATDDQIQDLLSGILLNSSVPAVGTPYMAAFEARALARCGRVQEMLDYIRNLWGGMLSAGAGTFWEAYDSHMTGLRHFAFYGRPFGKSLCHAWSAGPVFLLSGEAFGARPLEPGWKRFAIANTAVEGGWMCASIPTPFGSLDISVEGAVTAVRVPEGTIFDAPGTEEEETCAFPGPCMIDNSNGSWSKK